MSAAPIHPLSGKCPVCEQQHDSSLVRLWLEHSKRAYDRDQATAEWFIKEKASLQSQFAELRALYRRFTAGKLYLGELENPSGELPPFRHEALAPTTGIPFVDLINHMLAVDNLAWERAQIMHQRIRWMEDRLRDAEKQSLYESPKKPAGTKS